MCYDPGMETDAKVRVKRGPKPDPTRAMLRAQFSEWSDRTFDTWWRGYRMARKWVIDGLCTHEDKVEIMQSVMDQIIRPNGTFSVAKQLAYIEAIDSQLRQYDAGHDETPARAGERGPESAGLRSATSTLEESS